MSQGEARVVLVADENKERVELIRAQLQGAGYAVISSVDGLQAFSLLQSTRIDVVLANI